MYGTGGPSGRPPGTGMQWRPLKSILLVLGIFIIVIVAVDRLVLVPPAPTMTPVSTIVAHLDKHDVRRVTIPARVITLELNDGTKLTGAVPADRDLAPLIRRSGADLSIANAAPPADEKGPFSYLLEFAPFVIMALLLIYILRKAGVRR